MTSTGRPSCATAKSPNWNANCKRPRNSPTSKQGEKRLLREVVTEDEIAEIVAAWTGMPVARLQEGEREKLLRLDEILHERGSARACRILLIQLYY